VDKSVEDHPFQPTFNWRLRPGYLSEGNSDFESVHVLIGEFLADPPLA